MPLEDPPRPSYSSILKDEHELISESDTKTPGDPASLTCLNGSSHWGSGAGNGSVAELVVAAKGKATKTSLIQKLDPLA